MDTVVLAAGLGTRLGPITDAIPKPLIPVGGKSPLLRLLAELPAAVDRIVLVIGHLGSTIRAAIGESIMGRPVAYVSQSPLNGTAGAVLQSFRAIQSEEFLVINGDDIYARADLEELIARGPSYLIRQMPLPRRMASCVFSGEHLSGFRILPKGSAGIVMCGAYCLSDEFFEIDAVPVPGNSSELSLPHSLVQLESVRHHVPVRASLWLPCGTPDEIALAEVVLRF